MRIPFTLEAWLKDKSQKVETRDGRSARIICTDVKDKIYPMIALVRDENDIEYCFSYTETGYLLIGSDSLCDLFLVTPEPELTDFEDRLVSFALQCNGELNIAESEARKWSKELLTLARKEIEDDLPRRKNVEEILKRAYLVKMAGSMGSISDFSNVHIYSESDIRSKCELLGASSYKIEYAHYDDRIHFHKWHVLDERGRHLLLILSPTDETPSLSEWNVIEEGM